MLAIETKYHGPTDFRGSRVSVKAEGCPRVTIEWDDALDAVANHDHAAIEFCHRRGWTGKLARGASVSGRGYTYVRLPRVASDLVYLKP